MNASSLNDLWLHEMPHEWQRSRIRNVAALSPNYSQTRPASDEPCTVVPMELLSNDGAIDVTNQQPFEDISTGLPVFEEGDVLFAKITPCMENGKGAFVRQLPTRYAFGSTEFHVLRAGKKVDGQFLYYATFNPVYRAYAAENMVGAAGQKRVSSRFLKDTRLFLPSLPEQQRIAAYLDASCAAIEAAVAAKRRQLETLDALRKSIVHQAVTGGIHPEAETADRKIPSYGQTPRHWKQSKLRYEISIQNGAFASDKLQDDGEFPILGGNGIMGHTYVSNVDGDTVVIGRVGALCGNAHFVEGKAWVSDNALIVKSRNYAKFLCHLFNTLNFNAQANNTAQPVITGTKIKNTYVVLPPLHEQREIADFVDRKEHEFRTLCAQIERQIATLTAYRKSLIHECVTGQRRVTEADLAAARRGKSPASGQHQI